MYNWIKEKSECLTSDRKANTACASWHKNYYRLMDGPFVGLLMLIQLFTSDIW